VSYDRLPFRHVYTWSQSRLDLDGNIEPWLMEQQAMKKAEKAKLNAMIVESEEVLAEESIYFKLDSGKSEVVQFKSYERLDKEVDWGDGKENEDTFRLNILNAAGEEKVFDRKFGHTFSLAAMNLIASGNLVSNQKATIKKAAGKYGEYTIIPVVDELTDAEMDEIEADDE